MINFELKENGIFYVTFEGIVTAKDIKNHLHSFDNIDNLPDSILIANDLQNATLKVNPDEIDEVSVLANNLNYKFKSIKTAIITINPYNTALSILFQTKDIDHKTSRKVFSTPEAAIDWLIGY